MPRERKRYFFEGGINNVVEKVLLPSGSFSQIQNMRPRIKGFESRTGQSRLHTTTDSAQEIMQLYQHIDRAGAKKVYAQRADGAVHLATNNPPTTTTGNFGSEIIAAPSSLTNLVPATFSRLGNSMLFSDGARQHQIFSGGNAKVRAFIKYVSAATIPAYPLQGYDYTFEVNDSDTSTFADLSSLDNSNDAWYVCTDIPAERIIYTVKAANANTATIGGNYWRNDASNYGWTSLTIGDGTAVAGKTLAQSGAMTWTPPSDEVPHFAFGINGFWYKFVVSAALDAEVQLSAVSYTSKHTTIQNVWDGVMISPAEAYVEYGDPDSPDFAPYSSDSIDASGMEDGLYVYAGFVDPIVAAYIDANVPNVTALELQDRTDISFVDGGSSEDYIKSSAGEFVEAGFEEGMEITVSGSTSNNVTADIQSLDSFTMYLPTGTLTDEAAGDTVDIAFSNATTISAWEAWTGAAFTAVSNLVDGTDGLSKSGFVSFQKKAVEKSLFEDSTTLLYWYRFKLDKKTSNSVNIGIRGCPYYNIETEHDDGVTNVAWQGRAVYTNGNEELLVSAKNAPMVLNGSDYARVEAGDGRSNKVLAILNWYAHLLVFQNEQGSEGGCVTLVEGYSPSTYGTYLVSNNLGILNPKCVDIAEGALSLSTTNDTKQKVAVWISKQGVYATEGRWPIPISTEIGAYFDTTKSTCINFLYKNQCWLKYDPDYKVIRVGLVTGANTSVDTFLVWDPTTGKWSTDTLGQTLGCMKVIDPSTGGDPWVIIGGGASDGFVYQLNNGTNDVGATTVAIDKSVTIELDAQALNQKMEHFILRTKANTGSIIVTAARNGNTTFNTVDTISQAALNTNDSYRRQVLPVSTVSDHIAIKFRNNTASQSMYLLDLMVDLDEEKEYVG